MLKRMTYSTIFETPIGERTVTYSDADIDKTDLAARLRADYRRGVYISLGEIAYAAYCELEAAA